MKINNYYIQPSEISILLFCIALPFMYYPKVLSGDTQPWIISSLLIAFFSYRMHRFLKQNDLPIILLAISCILVYMLRSESPFMMLRNTYLYLTFILLWVVIQRGDERIFLKAIKFTIVLWFLVGMFQLLSDKFGFELEVAGRWHKIVKQGPPSLTAEASFYGSISVISIMYLLSVQDNKKNIYILLAVISVLISGSLLSILLLLFPLMRLPLAFKIGGVIFLPIFILIDFYYGGAGVSSRIGQIFDSGVNMSGILNDPSLNLRGGHIYYTLFEKLPESLFFQGEVNFLREYNDFANSGAYLIETGTPFILPAVGEMIYGSGLFALILFILLLTRVWKSCAKINIKVLKLGFVFACMLNPVSISNPFLILYILKKEK